MKKIALFGGSFNPPHDGHFLAMKHIIESTRADEIWMLYSINHQKDASKYAGLTDRMEMGRILQSHYPDIPVVLSDIEEEIGTHITHDVLIGLKDRFPNDQFIWTMGSDNLATFHTWHHAGSILENFPVIVIDRPPYEEKALNGPTALTYPHLKKDTPQEAIEAGYGWCVIKGPNLDISSSHLLAELRQGRQEFRGGFQKVAEYIRDNNLYGVGAQTAAPAAPEPIFI